MPDPKKKKVKFQIRTSFNPERDEKEKKRKKKKEDQLTKLTAKKAIRMSEGKGTKNIDRRIKRKKKQISGDSFWQKLKRWDTTWN